MYRLLIVDDKETCEKIAALTDWRAFGFDNVDTACSYPEAVDKVLDMQPHAALVAVNLGDQKGYSLVQHLRSVGLKTVFCMIARPEEMCEVRYAMRAGARDVIRKPVEDAELTDFLQWVAVKEFGGKLPGKAEANPELDPVLQKEYAEFSKITNKILLVVRNDYRRSLSLMGIADNFNMSSKYMGRIFMKDTGMRFTEYLMAYRMLEAQKLILGTREKISVIAGMVGYSQLNNFYIHFRNYFGKSPSSLRNFEE